MFWIYLARVPHNLAFQRLSDLRAINAALAMAFRKDGGTPDSVRADMRDAYLQES